MSTDTFDTTAHERIDELLQRVEVLEAGVHEARRLADAADDRARRAEDTARDAGYTADDAKRAADRAADEARSAVRGY